MKKNLLLSFLVLFVLNTIAFAGMSDPKKESEKPAIKDLKENRLSNEEVNHMNRRAETENLSGSSLLNKDESDSKNSLKPPTQVYVENNHHHYGYYYGGAAIILLVILIIVLV
jgi:cytochrome oxidase assembly protein ShyY1